MRYLRIGVWVALLVLVLGPPALFAFAMFGPRFPTDFESRYHKIQNGMSLADVRSVLGNEADEFTEGPTTPDGKGGQQKLVHGTRILYWEGAGQFIWVGITNDRAVSKHFFEYDL